jgi:hypothetical protein
MRIEFVKQWGSNIPGRTVDIGRGGDVTEGQADILIRRGIAREVVDADVTADVGEKVVVPKATKTRK